MSNYHVADFPFEIQNKLKSIEQAHRKGIQMQHVWGVFQAEGAIGYAPPHVPDADYYVVTNESVAPLFKDAPENCFFDVAWLPFLSLQHNYWN